MPLYEYKCRDCGRVTEMLVRSPSAAEPPRCAHCCGRNLEKLISTPAAVTVGGHPAGGKTCCGKTERCDTPPCSLTGGCRRD